MKNTSLIRSIPFWLLLALSLAAAAVGGWLVWDNTATMQRTLLDGTATNIEVYVGQAWITAGSAILAAGVIGVLLSLGLAAAKALIPTMEVPASVADASTGSVTETVDKQPIQDDTASASDEQALPEPVEGSAADEDAEDQNGNSGSTATATKISVK